ncbi:MAG: hypothetical protein ACTJF0_11475 [Psychroflexus halocasei]
MLDKFRNRTIILLISICALQFSFWGVFEPVYGLLRNIIIFLTIVLFITVDFKRVFFFFKNNPIIKKHLFFSVTLLIISVVYYGIGKNIEFSVLRDLFIVFGISIISFSFEFTENQIRNLFFLYSTLFLLSILSIIFLMGSGFSILDIYIPVPKNQLAPAFAVGTIISFYSMLFDKKRRNIYIVFFALYMISLLVLRARATIIGTFLTCFLILFIELRHKKGMLTLLLFLIVLILSLGYSFIYDALFRNFDTSSIDSISTGRMERNVEGINFLSENFLFGESNGKSYGGGIIHNYFLKNLVGFGFLAFIPICAIYFIYLRSIFKSITLSSHKYIFFKIGPYALFLFFFVSLFEYSFPFSPVSATFFPFFLFYKFIAISNKRN